MKIYVTRKTFHPHLEEAMKVAQAAADEEKRPIQVSCLELPRLGPGAICKMLQDGVEAVTAETRVVTVAPTAKKEEAKPETPKP